MRTSLFAGYILWDRPALPSFHVDKITAVVASGFAIAFLGIVLYVTSDGPSYGDLGRLFDAIRLALVLVASGIAVYAVNFVVVEVREAVTDLSHKPLSPRDNKNLAELIELTNMRPILRAHLRDHGAITYANVESLLSAMDVEASKRLFAPRAKSE